MNSVSATPAPPAAPSGMQTSACELSAGVPAEFELKMTVFGSHVSAWGSGRPPGGTLEMVTAPQAEAANRHAPLDWRAMAANEFVDVLVVHDVAQPAAYPTWMRPVLSIVMSMKSSRLRSAHEPPSVPARLMQPPCTLNEGVASYDVQLPPPSYVTAT